MAQELDRGDADVALGIIDRFFEQPSRSGAADRRERLDHRELQVALALFQEWSHAVGRARKLETPGETHHLELYGRVGARERLQHFRGVRLRQSLGGCLDESPHALVVEFGQPPHERSEGVGAQLAEQLAQFFFGGMARRLIERLQQLRQRVGL